MPILNVKLNSVGQTGVTPRIVYIETNDTIATVTTAGYLNDAIKKENLQFSTSDICALTTKSSPNALTSESNFYQVSYANGDWTLKTASSTATLPTTADHIATYLNAEGDLTQDPEVAILANDLQVGGDILAQTDILLENNIEVKGDVILKTGTQTDLILRGSQNIGGVITTVTNAAQAQASTYYISDVNAVTGCILVNALSNADPSPNYVSFRVSVTAASLASGQSVTLYEGIHAGAQYRLREIIMSPVGTDFSGGGGNRLLHITDGTSVYSIIPAATLQSLSILRWGQDTGLPWPTGGITPDTLTVAEQPLRAVYAGGTTDYTQGEVILSGMLERYV